MIKKICSLFPIVVAGLVTVFLFTGCDSSQTVVAVQNVEAGLSSSDQTGSNSTDDPNQEKESQQEGSDKQGSDKKAERPAGSDSAAKEETKTDDSKDPKTAKTAPKNPTLSPLIDVPQLKKLMDSGTANVRILEPSAKLTDFQKGHIPTAVPLHWVKDMINPKVVEKYSNLEPEQFVELAAELGIDNDTRIVIYDRLNSRLSTRLYWMLKYFGHDKVQVLDGGFAAWESEFEISTGPAADAKTTTKLSLIHI